MIKRMIILIVMGLTLSSCDFIHYGKIAIQDNVRRIEMEREREKKQEKKMHMQQRVTLSMKQG